MRENGAPGMGAAIREARLASGISLGELGRRVGVSASFISQVELGRATPSIGTLYTVVSELDLSLDSLPRPSSPPRVHTSSACDHGRASVH